MFRCLFLQLLCCDPPQPHCAAQPSCDCIAMTALQAHPRAESRAIQRIQGICAHPQIAHDHGNSWSEAAHRATTERNLRINACTGLHCGATSPPIGSTKGQTRRPGARNWCIGDPAKEKKQPRNSSLSDGSPGIRRTQLRL
jgi:hypothetical protein